MATNANPSLFVSGLTNDVNEEVLHEAFIPFGEIASVSLPKPEMSASSQMSPCLSTPNSHFPRKSSTDPHRGFATLTFAHPSDAAEALDNMDQSELFGRVLTVRPAKEAKAEEEKLGSRTAVWEQEGYSAKFGAGVAEVGDEERGGGDAMEGLEGLDVAGPKRQ
ncbi:hypothetical protein LTR95_004745 [Oleoguttula sp. CCFEE 5521]